MAGKKVASISLAELVKRVPKNQMDDFNRFRDKNAEYKRRVNKYPETLPKIDWEYYRLNVRETSLKMVEEFEAKYKELNEIFDSRVDLDLSKYYAEIEQQCEEVKRDLEAFRAESCCRIAQYEAEMLRLRKRKPYVDMTCEEYSEIKGSLFALPDGTPTFWPHLPDEQTPGPSGVSAHEHEENDIDHGAAPPPPAVPAAQGAAAGMAVAPPYEDEKEAPQSGTPAEGGPKPKDDGADEFGEYKYDDDDKKKK